MYQSNNLSHTDAMKIISVVQAEIEKQDQGGAVAVTDAHGELIAFLRTDGCTLLAITVAINKAYTAARAKNSSAQVGKDSRQFNFPMTNFGDPRFVSWGGGVPVKINGEVVGAVGVSGLLEEVDVELAQLGADLFNK